MGPPTRQISTSSQDALKLNSQLMNEAIAGKKGCACPHHAFPAIRVPSAPPASPAARAPRVLAARMTRHRRGCSRQVWETSDEDEEEEDGGERQRRAKAGGGGSGMPAGMDWLGGIVKPIDDMGKNIGQLFCPFLMPVSQDTLVKEYCEARCLLYSARDLF